MAVHAHPDDESSKGAATMARYVDEGVDVLVVTCTGGERGSILNPALQHRAGHRGQHRRDPARRDGPRPRRSSACGSTGSASSTPGCPRAIRCRRCPRAASRSSRSRRRTGRLVARSATSGRTSSPPTTRTAATRTRTTSACHEISVAAFEAAADPDPFPDAGEPWQPLKLYYDVGFTQERIEALHDAMIAKGLESPYEEWRKRREEWREQAAPRRRSPPGCRSPTGSSAATPRCSRTPPRSTPNGWFFKVPLRPAARGLADRGLRAGPLAGRLDHSRGRPVRRRAGAGRTS